MHQKVNSALLKLTAGAAAKVNSGSCLLKLTVQRLLTFWCIAILLLKSRRVIMAVNFSYFSYSKVNSGTGSASLP
jgi:hypothetical protein